MLGSAAGDALGLSGFGIAVGADAATFGPLLFFALSRTSFMINLSVSNTPLPTVAEASKCFHPRVFNCEFSVSTGKTPGKSRLLY